MGKDDFRTQNDSLFFIYIYTFTIMMLMVMMMMYLNHSKGIEMKSVVVMVKSEIHREVTSIKETETISVSISLSQEIIMKAYQ